MANDLHSIAEKVKSDHSASTNENAARIPSLEEEFDSNFPEGKAANNEADDTEESSNAFADEDNEISEFEREEPESVINGSNNNYDEDDDDDENPVVAGVSDFSAESYTPNQNENSFDDEDNGGFEVTDEDLALAMPDIPAEDAKEHYDKVRSEVESYWRRLVMSGMLPDEADAAASVRLNKIGGDENIAYLKQNPQSLSVVVNKQDADKLEFTPEERQKMAKTKVIQLKVVEDATLKELKVKRVDKKRKLAALQTIESSLSQYSVPLPLMNDYCKFKGAQIVQLLQAVRYNDTTLDEMINKKASMVYAQLVNGSVLEKTDAWGKTTMNFSTFCNKFLFHDLDMALYGILVASSMEEIESELTCPECNQSFTWKYNLKTLLTMDDMSDAFKERFDEILENKTNADHLQEMYEANTQTHIVQSPITNHVYHINYPTVARAMALYRAIDQDDETMIYLSAVALFIDKLLVYDKRSEEYIEVDESEIRELMEVLQNIPQEEIDILQKYIAPMLYTPKFVLKSRCEHCGNTMSNTLSIDDLVFLRARDSSTETRL
jgi:hypothetical protein